ncbi:hypothetical protein [Paenibacillus sp. OV219]|uniref:hypothetical protein n=1 Tax=Paenibacillus sp. OV219 TaxID=1884377 RepID=UPI0008B4CC84|nr:hypothetical protein [Paenibacillus sp. OV219]SEP15089.1 hypothetical protein SAMN05518847_12026 [Paenibacillus sp. OV219]
MPLQATIFLISLSLFIGIAKLIEATVISKKTRDRLNIIAVTLFVLVLLGSYVFKEIHKAEESGISEVVSDVTDIIIYFGFLFIFLRFKEPIKELVNTIIKKYK